MFAQPLENALLDAINSHDLEAATTLIDLIKKNKTASLFAINNIGENFLHIALRERATDIFELMYTFIKNGEKAKSYLSKPDCNGNSLFELALRLDTPRVATTLFTDFEQAYSLSESLEVFFRENKSGDSPLHSAACEEESESLRYILGKISEADGSDNKSNQDFSEIRVHSAFFVSKNPSKTVKPLKPVDLRLCQVNKKGESPLHLAASRGYIANSVDLINAGVSPFSKNKKGETALDLFERSPSSPSVCSIKSYNETRYIGLLSQ
jgi:ankyrin repeat protein